MKSASRSEVVVCYMDIFCYVHLAGWFKKLGRAVTGGTARRQAQNVPLRTRLHGMTLHNTRKYAFVAFHSPIQLGGTEAEA
jgi:hypothetical protein